MPVPVRAPAFSSSLFLAMSFSKLNADTVYQIAGHVLAEYIDTAITTPPRPVWAASYSKDIIKVVLSIISERRCGLGQPTQLSGSDWTEWSGVTEQDFFNVAMSLAQAAESVATKQTSTQLPSNQPSSTSRCSSGNPATSLQTLDSDASDTMVDDSTDIDSDLTLDLEDDEHDSSDSSDDTESDFGDDSDDSDYDSDYDEDGRKEFFKIWELNEALEQLPPNPIGSLLAVDASVRKATLKVVHQALGLQPHQGKNFLQEVETLLRFLRKGYRVALTRPFAYTIDFVPDYKGPETPLIDAYISLSIASYSQRGTHKFLASPVLPPHAVGTLMEMMKGTKYLAVGITPAFLRDRLSRRAHIYDRRYRAYVTVLRSRIKITEVLSQLFENVGAANNSMPNVNSKYCPDIRKVVHDLKVFDDKYMDEEFFSLLPRPLIKALNIRCILRSIAHMTRFEEYMEHEDLVIAAGEARELLEKYRRRCTSAKTLFVILK